MDRRVMLSSLTALFGASVAGKAAAETAGSGVKGFMVFTVNVGMLPPYKAEAFIARQKDEYDKIKIPGWHSIFMPVRPPQETRFDIYFLDEKGTVTKAREMAASGNAALAEGRRKHFAGLVIPPDFKEKTLEYVLLMLGAPVVKVELDEDSLGQVYESVMEDVGRFAKTKGVRVCELPLYGLTYIQQGVLAKAKIVLGHERQKWGRMDSSKLDGTDLVYEGTSELSDFYDRMESL